MSATPPPASAAALAEWCGLRKGRTETSPCPCGSWPAMEGWRRCAVPAWRVQPCQLRRAVSGRAPGVFPRESGSPAPAFGGWADHGQPRGRQRHLSQPLPAGGSHEPLQMRLLRTPHPAVHLLTQCRAAVPQPGIRPAAGSHRPVRGDGPHRL